MIRWFEKRAYLSIIILLLITVTIFYMSAQTFEKGSPGPEFPLKSLVYHFSIFFLLSLFLLVSIVKGKYKKLFLIALFLGLFYALTDEFHQIFVPNRSSTLGDFLTDSFGIFIAAFIYSISLETRKN